MDAFTHGLASYSVTRAAFPRASRFTLFAAILAGAAADLDRGSAYVGPSAFFDWHRTATHSIPGTLLTAVGFAAAVPLARRRQQKKDPGGTVFLALLAVCSLHVAMDLTQNESVQLL